MGSIWEVIFGDIILGGLFWAVNFWWSVWEVTFVRLVFGVQFWEVSFRR